MELTVKSFDELTNNELYNILKSRVDIFVVEQNCPYKEIDDKDQMSYHVFYHDGDEILAYLRVVPPGVSFECPALGRVITVRRGVGLGMKILLEGIRVAKEKFGSAIIKFEAQVYAKGFYEKAGFKQISDEFLEDGIPHIIMMRGELND